MDMLSSIDFTDPLVIAGGALVAIILVIIAYYAFGSSGDYVWSPNSNFAASVGQAVSAGTANGGPLYVAAAPTASGSMILGKASSTTIWYYDGGVEKKIAIANGWLLPASIGALTWSSKLTRGVTLSGVPGYVCRASVANGIHPGYAIGGIAYITYGGKVQTSSTFEYLNVA